MPPDWHLRARGVNEALLCGRWKPVTLQLTFEFVRLGPPEQQSRWGCSKWGLQYSAVALVLCGVSGTLDDLYGLVGNIVFRWNVGLQWFCCGQCAVGSRIDPLLPLFFPSPAPRSVAAIPTRPLPATRSRAPWTARWGAFTPSYPLHPYRQTCGRFLSEKTV